MGTTFAQSEVFSTGIALVAPIISLSLALTILGIYIFLFGLTSYHLGSQAGVQHRQLQFVWITSLFLISALGALSNVSSGILDAVILYNTLRSQDVGPFLHYVEQNETQTALVGVAYTCLIVANSMADAVLIHRIYLVWGSKKAVLILPILASLAINSVGLAGTVMRTKGFSNTSIASNFNLESKGINFHLGFYYANAAVNFIFTMLIASRLWWIIQQKTSEENAMKLTKYKMTVAILLECGLLYPISLIAHAAIEGNVDKILTPVNLTPTVIILAGLVPTIIILRTCQEISLTDKALQRTTHVKHLETTSVEDGTLDEKH
ncbi:hypothetical protein GYMLUDRAFT_438082 [Collybiopsis luxurians FD-317 M1]|uniref:Uncharacterized protein n=1 Tax=Collybiopsis luxurians FD-317 M1 TaxID=944289 RepID=A0A0D0C7D0_9AGAR|nr:hypothetical protein GYMLUDRAFT_438082 [Collybiopsis luxurians FD-317 M1]